MESGGPSAARIEGAAADEFLDQRALLLVGVGEKRAGRIEGDQVGVVLRDVLGQGLERMILCPVAGLPLPDMGDFVGETHGVAEGEAVGVAFGVVFGPEGLGEIHCRVDRKSRKYNGLGAVARREDALAAGGAGALGNVGV